MSKGLATVSDEPGVICRSDLSSFYNFMRRNNLFLTRDVKFLDLKEEIITKSTTNDDDDDNTHNPSEMQTFKRVKLSSSSDLP